MFILLRNYVNADLEKPEILMNLKSRKETTEIEYYQEIWNIKKKQNKQKQDKFKEFPNIVAIFKINSIDFILLFIFEM